MPGGGRCPCLTAPRTRAGPCGACGELLSVPVTLHLPALRCRARRRLRAAPELHPVLRRGGCRAARPRICATDPRSPGGTTMAPNSAIPLEPARVELPHRLIHAQQDEQEYPDHMTDREEVHAVDETVASDSQQRNRFPLGRGITMEKRQVLPSSAARRQVNDQHSSCNIQAKRAQLACLHRIIHSEEVQEGPLSHEVYREARHTELTYETGVSVTDSNRGVGCSVCPRTRSVEKRHVETPNQIIQQLQKQPFHAFHAARAQVGRLDGVIHAQEVQVQPEPDNQAIHGEEARIRTINKTIARDINWTAGCSVGPNTVSAGKRKALTTNKVTQQTVAQKQQSDATCAEHAQIEHSVQAIHEPNIHTIHREAVCPLPKETTARCSKRKISHLVDPRTIVKKRQEPLNHSIQQAERRTSDIESCNAGRIGVSK